MTALPISANAAHILNGKQIGDELLAQVAQDLKGLVAANRILPKLVVVLVGDDAASQVYVNKKAKTARSLGMSSEVLVFPTTLEQNELLREVARLNEDPSVHGILIQLPLPKRLNSLEVINAIDPRKDVDGLHPLSLGRLLTGETAANACLPCTPAGIMTLLKAYNVPIAGKHAVVLGRSNIVGKPIGLLLLQENATVSYCHSKTPDLANWIAKADILIAAAGVPGLVHGDAIRPGAVVVDVGINRVDGKLVGDVDFASVSQKAAFVTPVPGGVGPMTIATLMSNTLACYHRIEG
jgi:methylenetetrahydrofolate dehydrogenase (NADP+)/methenyltetrahydrofolate cyclohydrolase